LADGGVQAFQRREVVDVDLEKTARRQTKPVDGLNVTTHRLRVRQVRDSYEAFHRPVLIRRDLLLLSL
jgi:hypothetical protein